MGCAEVRGLTTSTIMIGHAAAMPKENIDTVAPVIIFGNAFPVPFEIAPERLLALFNRSDKTDRVLGRCERNIAAFEAGQRKIAPWLYPEDL